MEIVTSYYAKYNRLKEDGYIVIAISITQPKNCFDFIFQILFPSYQLLYEAKQYGKNLPKEYHDWYIKKI